MGTKVLVRMGAPNRCGQEGRWQEGCGFGVWTLSFAVVAGSAACLTSCSCENSSSSSSEVGGASGRGGAAGSEVEYGDGGGAAAAARAGGGGHADEKAGAGGAGQADEKAGAGGAGHSGEAGSQVGAAGSAGSGVSAGGVPSGSGGSGGGAAGGVDGSGGSSTPAAGAGGGSALALEWQPLIVVDQFGYRTVAEKIAVVRDPQVGFDADQAFVPSEDYAVVDADTGTTVFEGAPAAWNDGSTDESSGDAVWWFDFSAVSAAGRYVVVDRGHGVRSAEFEIGDGVYRAVLAQALKAFFYQRSGFEKTAEFAGTGWADGASHVGAGQDTECRLYSAPDDASTERDLHGGWYDAGDYNKYTPWHARYVVELLRAYRNTPAAFGDDIGIPESGNGRPDVLDEARFGMDWLERMQQSDGSLLSIVGAGHASPPSAATDPCYYGSPSTAATLAGAASFAIGAWAFSELGEADYAESLLARAEAAWNWAEANPSVLFYNNDTDSGTSGLGSGQQEVDDDGRFSKRMEAAVYLFAASGDSRYSTVVDDGYQDIHLMAWGFAYPFEMAEQELLLEYSRLEGATPSVASSIVSTYRAALDGDSNLGAQETSADPYLAYLQDYVWGSNSTKASQGLIFADAVDYDVDSSLNDDAMLFAERYVHYFHGVNPLGLVYLSNMGGLGAESSVTEFYHSWFCDGSELWDSTETSTYGPPPGFLVGGPNPSYDVDGCCPSGCGSAENNALCDSESVEPPRGQPVQKSYKQFNTAWPLNSWEVTENSNGYQLAYIRLLAKFAE